eukprot:CAMPEP_0206513544 /NCGR_PEP_ID=MMETSP0324_2-20121206/61581_1 /ASSEMBLY_ACC=CAM_ASM_000836 /TAXON_ID=2866 /ORGANISM="Crypthecodinium cohnii, Strain Seligo" /LENGTH=46 /DNA_ID= /DNA_START= /DNA_END= /DNA_ORIENTATION=
MATGLVPAPVFCGTSPASGSTALSAPTAPPVVQAPRTLERRLVTVV